MGDLKGHILPGTAFLLYGLWWAVGSIRRFFLCRRAGQKYTSTVTFPCPFSCGKIERWPVESIAKILISALGLFGEILLNQPHPNTGIVQHATMYLFFAISGLVDLSMHLGLPLPPGTDYAALALAFTMEGFLFTNHLHERDILDVKIHVLLAYVVFLTVIVILLEARYQKSVVLTLSRTFLVMLQGSWFWAVGLILYGHGDPNQAWNLKSHTDVMLATIYFSWHCGIIFITLAIMAAVMSVCYRWQDGSRFRNGSDLPMTVLDSSDKHEQYKLLTVQDNEDSDLEFEQPVKKTTAAAPDTVQIF